MPRIATFICTNKLNLGDQYICLDSLIVNLSLVVKECQNIQCIPFTQWILLSLNTNSSMLASYAAYAVCMLL